MFVSLAVALSSLLGQTLPKVTVEPSRVVATVQPSLYGIFFEEINRAGEGGLYAELLDNRGFEQTGNGQTPGWKSESGQAVIDPLTPFNASRPRSMRFQGTVSNSGFWGIGLKSGESYRLDVWAKGSGELKAELGGQERRLGTLGATWTKYTTTFSVSKDATASLRILSADVAWLGFSSLMSGRPAAKSPLRKDLAGLVAGMRPGFVRFPGGCYVEGQRMDQAWDWKATLGPVESRRGQSASFWGYPTSGGLGYHEYLQWCEDMKADALFVANCGMSHEEVVPIAKMGPVVQNVLDAIEYAIGPVSSNYGRMRAKNGHPGRFPLRYLEIGNENGGPAYNERYRLIAKAVKERYPQITLIACVWGGTPTSYPLEVIDEHYYSDPSFFWANAKRYDSYDRKGPKIYVGEYAVTRNCGRGNLDAALAEAAFMTGFERNADLVVMSSYAPLLCNTNDRQWNPNAIVFDHRQTYGTPSYWVQRIFSENRPEKAVALRVDLPTTTAKLSGTVALQTWATSAEFKDLRLEVDGQDKTPASFSASSGNWKEANGTISQSDLGTDHNYLATGLDLAGAHSVRFSVKARKRGGAEGFIFVFGAGSGSSIQWNLGGWGNTLHAFQSNAGNPMPGNVPGSIEANRWYDITVEIENGKIRGLLDGNLVQETALPVAVDFAASAGTVDSGKELVVKLVNRADHTRTVPLNVTGLSKPVRATRVLLTGPSLQSENSFSNPGLVAPRTATVEVGPKNGLSVPKWSVVIYRIPLK